MSTRIYDNWRVAHELARRRKPGQTITNKQLVDTLCDKYPELKGKPGRIIAADHAANSPSGYSIKIKRESGEYEWDRRYPAVLFTVAYNEYVKYDPKLHGFWTCREIDGKKTVVGILIKIGL